MAVRIFLSFNERDRALAASVRTELLKLQPDADIFFSPESMGHGLWMPKLADGVQAADGFLLVLGPHGAGRWQTIEFYEAFERHAREPGFAVVPLIAANGHAPGLRFLRQLNWIDLSEPVHDNDLRRVWTALKGDGAPVDPAPWRRVHPYRGLEAMTEAEADYFFGREAETGAVLSLLATKPGRLPLLIGASGVGKSSIAQAGVLSALKTMHLPLGKNSTSAAWPEAFRDSRKNWAWLVVRPETIRYWRLPPLSHGCGCPPPIRTLGRSRANGLRACARATCFPISSRRPRPLLRRGTASGRSGSSSISIRARNSTRAPPAQRQRMLHGFPRFWPRG
jgi:hypothetical protein